MDRFLLSLKFDGTAYHGWQVQPNGNTVQAEMCRAAESVFGRPVGITGCSRTDSGVHANMFCCHFDADTSIPPEKIIAAFNSALPRDIAVFDCKRVAPDFHARYSAKAKNYHYLVFNSRVRDPFFEGRALRISAFLDEKSLSAAALRFVGRHDFSSFCAAGASTDDHVRTVSEFDVFRTGDLVTFSVTADGFLYNMVRIMVGTLLDIASGRIKESDLPEIIGSKDRSRAGNTAPACGLYLNRVYY